MTASLRMAWLLAAVLVAGCATSPAPRYYRLTAEATAAAQPVEATPVVIGPFAVAEYLARPQIVSRAGDNLLDIDDYARWAEPLDASFQAVVAANVGRLLGSDQVLEFPAQAILKADRRVSGRIVRFDVDAGGEAVLEVQWGIVDAAGAVRQPGRVSRYAATAAGRTTADRVAALNATVTAFSYDVAAALGGER